MSDELREGGDVVLGEPDADDGLPFEGKTATGGTCSGIDYYTEAVDERPSWRAITGSTAPMHTTVCSSAGSETSSRPT